MVNADGTHSVCFVISMSYVVYIDCWPCLLTMSVALTAKQFKSLCSERTKYVFVENWHTDLHDKPLLRSYRLYKNEFSSECYLDYINVTKFRISLSKIRASSHDLEIERGRYTRPKTDPKQRLCAWCLEVEDEEHFITRCQINAQERHILYTKIGSKHPEFQNISNHEQFIFLMSCKDRQILTWLGKFLHKSFNIRNVKSYKPCIPSR